MLRGDGNENGKKKKKEKSIGPIKPGPPMRNFTPAYKKCTYVRTYRRTFFSGLNLLDA